MHIFPYVKSCLPYKLFSPFQFYFIGFESQEAKIYINIFPFFLLLFVLFELIIREKKKYDCQS
jgi:hypothetical protein